MGLIYSKIKKIAYKVIELITLGNGVPTKINGFKIKLPTKYFRLFPSDYESSNFDFYKKHVKSGDIILDIGAHIGLYAVFFAKHCKGKVYSFEPTLSTLKWLRKTVEINKCNDTVNIVPFAISGKKGKDRFYLRDANEISFANSLINFGDKKVDKIDGSYEVDLISIDEFVSEHGIKPNILKIDAEGVELELLKGAANTFLNFRPIATLGLHLFAYTNRIETLANIWDLLVEYKMNVFIDGEPITKEFFCQKEERVFDIQLLPNEIN